MFRLVKSLAATAVLAGPAAAGWDNVFQLTCCDGPSITRSYAAPAADCPSPCEPQARVSYQQRCYYQPETSYKRESYWVPVKENVKSYYYEPVTSYKYTSYYDPCSGQCQQICTPTTSYAVKEQCNSVTRWVEQSRMVPVTSYRAVTMYTPVVTYYYPPVSSPSAFKIPLAPRVEEKSNTAPPAETDLIPKTDLKTTPNSTPRAMPKATQSGSAYTASRAKAGLRGEVVLNDQVTPRANTKVIFLNAADTARREETQTNAFGEFDVQLPAGDWYVYLGQGTGKATFHKKLTVTERQNRDVTLVSR
jgi:hypothetical protein